MQQAAVRAPGTAFRGIAKGDNSSNVRVRYTFPNGGVVRCISVTQFRVANAGGPNTDWAWRMAAYRLGVDTETGDLLSNAGVPTGQDILSQKGVQAVLDGNRFLLDQAPFSGLYIPVQPGESIIVEVTPAADPSHATGSDCDTTVALYAEEYPTQRMQML